MRLPAKSLMKFKCISKHWSSLISSRYFCNHVFTVARQQQPRLYMCLVDQFGQRELLSLSMSSTSPDNTCFVVDQDLSIPGMRGFFLMSIVHDFMCFYVTKNACIYNPNTKQLLTLPAKKSDTIDEQGQRKDTRDYIGHDPVNDHYKLFCTIAISSRGLANLKSEHWVFVLEAGGLWKKVVPREHYRHAPLSRGWFVSGSVVHYMAWLDIHICAVVSFEITSEELTIIPVWWENSYIRSYSYLDDEGLVDLWVLEDVGKKKWSKQTLVLQPCQRHLVHDTELKVKGTTRDGKVILAPSEMSSGFYIMYYDIQSNSLTRVEIEGVPHYWFDKKCHFD